MSREVNVTNSKRNFSFNTVTPQCKFYTSTCFKNHDFLIHVVQLQIINLLITLSLSQVVILQTDVPWYDDFLFDNDTAQNGWNIWNDPGDGKTYYTPDANVITIGEISRNIMVHFIVSMEDKLLFRDNLNVLIPK